MATSTFDIDAEIDEGLPTGQQNSAASLRALLKQITGFAASIVDTNLLTDEQFQDKVGDFLANSVKSGINIVYDDANNRMNISVPASMDAEGVQDIVGTLIQAGASVTVNYNDTANTLTISASSYTDEMAQDALAALFSGGTMTNIMFSYNDALNKMDVTVTFPNATGSAAGLMSPADKLKFDSIPAGINVDNKGTITSYTLQSTDLNKTLRFTNSSLCTVTIPSNLLASNDFVCAIHQAGTAQVQVAGATTPSAVTVVNADSQLKTAKQYCTITLYQVAANSYVIEGRTGA